MSFEHELPQNEPVDSGSFMSQNGSVRWRCDELSEPRRLPYDDFVVREMPMQLYIVEGETRYTLNAMVKYDMKTRNIYYTDSDFTIENPEYASTFRVIKYTTSNDDVADMITKAIIAAVTLMHHRLARR